MKTFFKILTGLGIFLLFGTAGASDMNSIDINQILKQLAMSVLMISSGLLSIKAITLKEAKNKYLKKRRNRDIMILSEAKSF